MTPNIFFFSYPQDAGGLAHTFRAIREGTVTPFTKRRLCSFQDLIDLASSHLREIL
jgi:hypothetical protein